MSEIKIRNAQLTDISELTSLIYGYLEFYKRPIPPKEKIEEMITYLINHPEEGFQLVAEENGGLIGFTTVNAIWSTTRMQKIALLNDLFIDPERRKKGAGETLLTSTIQLAKEKGYPLVRLLTAADNVIAQSLYDKTGGNAPGWKVYDYQL
ncbi:hypothetical protein AM501_06935 [Aneurinibacillus migulanus]|uniref:Ribosomal protein S18 acetylase RimI n=1 Tax=Aneurinibacillus migulanus TaxID=47500 RepID=A0A0D1W2N5_ANEMI|nr:GNAT family N-acetyltransferase [Aneurinibacillus migulanus]KIV50110.1 hypothetical protein TS65_30140 [Aneurinibacillus migulanus]KIV52685.1 hypothetical protein TS64_22055 [Aneurinibacillus migulanus]KON96136.1 hypothetical protein AF333_12230 [Aneurinibacillus migulanus]KPD08997.1 hypothetical protein AM501_06935 [Aneurinibacillus migulanus]MED0894601.1 GNAT family N-acetyltransferase [Aneurinibacillus migulanus]